MDKSSVWKWLILICALAGSLALVYPPKEKITLGIDLQGGISFVLQVDTEELDANAKEDALERALEVINNRVNALGTLEPIIYPEPSLNRIVIQIPGVESEKRDEIVDIIERTAHLEFRMVDEDSDAWTAEVFNKNLAPSGYKIITLSEPGFNGALQQNRYYAKLPVEGDAESVDAAENLAKFQYRAGNEFMLVKDERQQQEVYTPYYVNIRPQLTGESLESAGVDYQQFGQPIVTLKFDGKGGKRFAHITGSFAPGGEQNPNPNNYRQLAIVLDNTLYSAPRIDEPIYGGEAIIRGNFKQAEAQRLSIVLRAGSLPAPVRIIQEQNVDPTLGRDSVDSGVRALMFGGVAVVIFMFLYYMLGGIVANLALGLDLLLLPLGMMMVSGFLGIFVGAGSGDASLSLPTLTLPGIAGIILTIGMAVDANVLIFERIREEQRVGKRFKSALSAGYDKAFSTILDANVTTLITAIILFMQGSGPIRGFAITLSAGIIVSMYVVLVVARMFFEILAEKTDIDAMKMLKIVSQTKINFVGKRGIAAVLSVLVIAGSWTMFVMRGDLNFGVDFTGGRAIGYEFAERKDVSEIRAALNDAGIRESFLQYQKELTPGPEGTINEILEVKVGFTEGELAKETMETQFASAGYSIIKEDSVGPQIGKELRSKGIAAIIWAIIGIVIYITIRFEFAFAVGAIVAVAHDVLVTVGLYCLLGRQLSLPIVAALLTIVGYSVNDTIVVFDRIREDRQLIKDKSFKEVANLSINRTLSRTLLTSITTLLSVVMLLLFGGGAINDFALALFIGILVGTYSSIFVATPVVLFWHKEKK